MVGHDPQRTSRSPVVGPSDPRLLFSFAKLSQPVIGSDGSIYGWGSRGLIAIRPSGHVRWTFPSWEAEAGGPPALAPSGVLYVVGFPARIPRIDPKYSRIFALTPSGRLRWQRKAYLFSKGRQPYVTGAGVLYAPFVGPYNAQLQEVLAGGGILRRISGSFQSMAQAPDGTIYAYLGSVRGLTAIDPGGTELWQRDLGSSQSFVSIVASDGGTVYVGDSQGAAAYDHTGGLAWRQMVTGPAPALALAGDGSLRTASAGSLTDLNTDGSVAWSLALGTAQVDLRPALAVDANGTSYVLAGDGLLRVVSASGAVLAAIRVCQPTAYTGLELTLGPFGRLTAVCNYVLHVYGS
jgi:outer membrane protein assembly factor BamB